MFSQPIPAPIFSLRPVLIGGLLLAPVSVASGQPVQEKSLARLPQSTATPLFSASGRATQIRSLISRSGALPAPKISSPRPFILAQASSPTGENLPEVPSGLATTTPDSPLPVVESPAEPTETKTPAENAAPTSPGDDSKSQVFAGRVAFENDIVVAEGTQAQPARLVAKGLRLRALKLTFDWTQQIVKADGEIVLERDLLITTRELRSRELGRIENEENFTSTARGQALVFDIKTQTGSLDGAALVLPGLNIDASRLQINGAAYNVENVILRPGGLSEEERKIYGTPPFSLRARRVRIFPGDTPSQNRVRAEGAALYFRSSKLFPLPSSLLRLQTGGQRDPGKARILPDLSANSADRLLLSTELLFPLDKRDQGELDLVADLGYSLRVGFRGGLSLQSRQNFGQLALGYRLRDVVSTQLTNRIELDRQPELSFRSVPFLTFNLPSGRRAGFEVQAGLGEYSERGLGSGLQTRARRTLARVDFSTRLARREGVFLNLFASRADYSRQSAPYNSHGFQVGYEGQLFPRVRGQISLLRTSLSGQTPFVFDRVEIAKEARATFDIELSKRWLLPVDLRYDLDDERLRDKTYGLLRSYKSFAYGVVYQAARRDLRLEFRRGF